MKKLALMAAAAIIYVFAAWMVAPGFYDGFGPPQPYNWTCPPPQAGANISAQFHISSRRRIRSWIGGCVENRFSNQ